MKKGGILHSDLARLVTQMGHGDLIAITDRGFPFPHYDNTECVDLAIGVNLPKVCDVLKVVLEELEIEKVIIANETKTTSPDTYAEMLEIIGQIKSHGKDIVVEMMPHPEFKNLVLNGALDGNEVQGFIRTGEFTLYANIILVCGVAF